MIKYTNLIKTQLNTQLNSPSDEFVRFIISDFYSGVKTSNVLEKFNEDVKYNYKIYCEKCNQVYYRQRLAGNFTKKYLCGICRGKFIVEKLK